MTHNRIRPRRASTVLLLVSLLTQLLLPAAQAAPAPAPLPYTWDLPDLPEAPNPGALAQPPEPLSRVLPRLQPPAPALATPAGAPAAAPALPPDVAQLPPVSAAAGSLSHAATDLRLTGTAGGVEVTRRWAGPERTARSAPADSSTGTSTCACTSGSTSRRSGATAPTPPSASRRTWPVPSCPATTGTP